jgi:hypothetical protein
VSADHFKRPQHAEPHGMSVGPSDDGRTGRECPVSPMSRAPSAAISPNNLHSGG